MEVAELRDKVRRLPPVDSGHPFWRGARQQLRLHMLKENPENFRDWPIIKQTMDCGMAEYVTTEFEEMQKDEPVIPDIFGVASLLMECGDGNAVHQLYHLYRFLRALPVKETNGVTRRVGRDCLHGRVVEFGGGFGELAGWVNTHYIAAPLSYSIYDFPELQLLQQFYMGMRGVNTTGMSWPSLKEELPKECDLLIGTWSLSEAPDNERNRFLDIDSKAYLFAYSKEFLGQDNVGFFNEVVTRNPDHLWYREPTPHADGRHEYLFGVRP